jgi:ABC-type amino acid transport substrate-binding protein
MTFLCVEQKSCGVQKGRATHYSRRIIQFLLIAITLITTVASPAPAQVTYQPARPATSIVTVLSDGLSEPAGGATQILNDISATLDKESGVRLLSINGYGGAANVRDLLQLRGTDLAILNNDVLAYPDLATTLPEAQRKVRLIAPLFHQSVLLFARQNIKSIEDLRGRKIGIPASRPSRGVTARTIFALLKIEAEFVELDDKELAKRARNLDAVLLYEKDLPGLRGLGITPASHHLLPIAVKGPLASIYMQKKIGKATVGGYIATDAFETIQVSTLLAAFEWSPRQGRYADVVNFVNQFFALVPVLRARNPHSSFSVTDVRAKLPGWKHFGPAEALATAAAPPSPSKDTAPLIAPAAETAPSADVLRMVAVARPPFTDPQDPDGGVTLKILTGALNAAGVPTTLQWVDNEKALLERLVNSKEADAALFWQTPHCDAPGHQTANEAELCDRTITSDPLMQTVIAVFTRIDTPLDPNSTDATQTRTLCVPESQTLPDEALAVIPWIKAASVKKIRPKTLIDCLAAVDRRDADALIAIEPEARFAIERLKLSQSFQISQWPGITTGLHVLVAKENPRQTQLIQTLNEAIAKFRSSGGYSAVMASHITDLARVPAKQP